MDEVFKVTLDDSEIYASLNRIEKELTDLEKTANKTGEAMTETFNKAGESVNEFSDSIAKNAKGISDQANAVKQADAANGRWLTSIKQTIAGQQVGGKTLAEWGDTAKEFAAKINLGGKAMEGASVVARLFGTALKGIGIGLIIGAIASLIAYFIRFQSGIDKVQQVVAGAVGAFDKLAQSAALVGQSLVKVFSGDFEGAANGIRQAFSLTAQDLLNAATAAAQLEKQFQQLRDATITAGVEIARQRTELSALKNVVDDDTQAIGKRIQVQQSAANVSKQIAQQEFDLALQRQQLTQKDFLANTENLAKKEEAAKAEIELQKASLELNNVVYDNEQKARELRKAAAEENRKAAEARKKALEEEAKLLAKINKDLENLRLQALGEGLDRDLAETNKRFDDLAKISEEGVKKLNEIEARRGLTPEEIAKREEFKALSKQIEEQRLGELLDVITEFNEKEIEIANEQEERKKALAERDLDRAVKSVEAEKQLKDEQINLTEQQNKKYLLELARRGASEKEIKEAEAELDVFIQAARLQNELEFQQNLLALTDKSNTEQVQQIEATIATIQAKITNLQIDPPKQKGKGIFGLLGIDDPDAQAAIKDATETLVSAINEVSQARIDAAAAEVERIDELIGKQEEAVSREAELAKEGLANDLATEKARLAELKKQRDAAAKEEAKARRAQILLDSVTQISSLVTASANIFKAVSSIGPFGVPLAIGLIAAMFAFFAAAKAKALSAASAPKLRKGGRLEGPSHELGGVPIHDHEGNVMAIGEGKEWVIATNQSIEHDRFLSRLNKGEFKGVNLDAIAADKKRLNPASEAVPRIREIERQKAEIGDAQHWQAMKAAYSEGAEKIVKAIDGKPTAYPWKNGYIKETKKGNVVERRKVLPE